MRAARTQNGKAACKRLIFRPDFYAVLMRENVGRVTEDNGASVPEAVRTKVGGVHEHDKFLFATGFHAADSILPTKWATGAGDSWRLDASDTPNNYPWRPRRDRAEIKASRFDELRLEKQAAPAKA